MATESGANSVGTRFSIGWHFGCNPAPLGRHRFEQPDQPRNVRLSGTPYFNALGVI